MNLQTVSGVEPQGRVEPVARMDAVASVLKVISEKEQSVSVQSVKKNDAQRDGVQMEHLLDQAEKMVKVFGRNLKFRYRKEADVYQVEVIDAESKEVVRKIPSDEMVRFIENINEMLGALFDTKA
jgi:uncharacterized FlaG/YvyC family protein